MIATRPSRFPWRSAALIWCDGRKNISKIDLKRCPSNRNIFWAALDDSYFIFLLDQCRDQCKAPDCRCFSTSPPGGLKPEAIPQLVFLTFDEAVTAINMVNYTSILTNRKNPNDCPIAMTFFVTHKSNDYTLTHDLFFAGNEIGSASIRSIFESWLESVVNLPAGAFHDAPRRPRGCRQFRFDLAQILRRLASASSNVAGREVKSSKCSAPLLQQSSNIRF